MRKFYAFLCDESGTETLEWGLVCGLIVVGALAAIMIIGPKVTSMWDNLANKVNAVPTSYSHSADQAAKRGKRPTCLPRPGGVCRLPGKTAFWHFADFARAATQCAHRSVIPIWR